MYLQEQQMLNGGEDSGNNRSSIEGLEQQLMAAVESPQSKPVLQGKAPEF